MNCRRCGLSTIRFTVDQRYCSRCAADVAAATAPKPEPKWLPLWRRVGLSKSLDGLPT